MRLLKRIQDWFKLMNSHGEDLRLCRYANDLLKEKGLQMRIAPWWTHREQRFLAESMKRRPILFMRIDNEEMVRQFVKLEEIAAIARGEI